MNSKHIESREQIVQILTEIFPLLDRGLLERAADRIYKDVVGNAIEETRSAWIGFAYMGRTPQLDS